MKKYLSLIAFAVMAVFSLTFVSCGDDDEDEPTNSSVDESELLVTMNGQRLYVYQEKGVVSRNQLAFIDNYEETPSHAAFMDAEDWENSKYLYVLDLCFSRFSLGDVGKELKLCNIPWSHVLNGYSEWEFKNTFGYVKSIRDGFSDEFAYVSGKILFQSLNTSKREIIIKFDNVVFECVEHEKSNMKNDKIVLNGSCKYYYYKEN